MAKSNVVSMFDGLANFITGLGIYGRDKSAGDTFACREISPVELTNAYRGDWVARKIIDIPALDMTREWREWQAESTDITALENEEKRLDVSHKINRALILDALFGGSAILLGGPGDPRTELTPGQIKQGGLKFINVLARWQLNASGIETDPFSPYFGEPKSYSAGGSAAGVEIHPSRVIRFVSRPRPEGETAALNCWGDSLLQSVYDAVHNAALAQQGVASLIHEAKIDVVSIPNLSDAVGDSAGQASLLKRFALANAAKSAHNVLILDKEEEWEQKTLSFAQLPDLVNTFLQVAAGAADMPVTRLLGQSPKGLNATGDMDLQNYYDSIAGKQNTYLRPRLDRLDQFLVPSALGSTPKDLWWEFAPLWQMSEKDKSAVELAKAQASQIYATTGLVPGAVLAQGVMNGLIDEGTYPGLEKAVEDYEAGLLVDPVPDPAVDPNADPNQPADPGNKPDKPSA